MSPPSPLRPKAMKHVGAVQLFGTLENVDGSKVAALPLEVRGTLLVLAEQGYVQREGVGWRLADADPRAPGQPYLDSTG